MGTEARVRPGLRAPRRPGFPSLDRDGLFRFQREAGLPLWGCGEQMRVPALFTLVPSLTGLSLPGACFWGQELFHVPLFFWAGDSSFSSAATVSKVLSCRAESLARSLH